MRDRASNVSRVGGVNDFKLRPNLETETYLVKTLTGKNRWKVNTYLVESKVMSRSLIIDPGEGEKELINVIKSTDYQPDAVLLTHGHFDHLVSAEALCREFSIKCLIHSHDRKLLRLAPFYGISFGGMKITPPQEVLSFDSPESPIEGWGIKIIPTPGHTPGGCCFLVDKFLFSGDTLIREAVGRTDNPGSNFNDLKLSVSRLLDESPENCTILPGHGRPWHITEAINWWGSYNSSPTVHDTFLLESDDNG